jgi:hypothetical protein
MDKEYKNSQIVIHIKAVTIVESHLAMVNIIGMMALFLRVNLS